MQILLKNLIDNRSCCCGDGVIQTCQWVGSIGSLLFDTTACFRMNSSDASPPRAFMQCINIQIISEHTLDAAWTGNWLHLFTSPANSAKINKNNLFVLFLFFYHNELETPSAWRTALSSMNSDPACISLSLNTATPSALEDSYSGLKGFNQQLWEASKRRVIAWV